MRYLQALRREWTWWSGWTDVWMLVVLAGSFLLVNAATEKLGFPFMALMNLVPEFGSAWAGVFLLAGAAFLVFLGACVLVRIARRGKPAVGIFGLGALAFWLVDLTLVVYWPMMTSGMTLETFTRTETFTVEKAESAYAAGQIDLERYRRECLLAVESALIFGEPVKQCRDPEREGGYIMLQPRPETAELAGELAHARRANVASRMLGLQWLVILAVLALSVALVFRKEAQAGTFRYDAH